jgi:integrase
MTRPRPPYLLKEITRHGLTVFYFRSGKGPRIRIHGTYGSKEFLANYDLARGGVKSSQRRTMAAKDTIGWLIAAYHESSAWARLAAATRRQREGIFRAVLAGAGDMPLADITHKTIRDGVDRRKATPSAANAFLITMKILFHWGYDQGHIEADPTVGLHTLRQKSEGFHTWTDEEIAKFEIRWPIGTRERLALAVLLYTGLRRGDAVSLGKQHIKHGVIAFRTAKTGQQVTIPLLPELARIIDATPTGDLTFIAGPRGQPISKDSFGHWFARACKAAGIPKGRAHGLRKAGATSAANNGATERELEALFGWKGGGMAARYTRAADREKLARTAIEKMRK